ncbi:hypothetical protein [Verrucomicrobium spinosum]|uniref:hypothetical protein n=1 Tax=Verrucomicrobium spinosum TaxID=2736 RepID=UPI00017463E3|nr:hypothetical protein [Verrucomicrobium spinosum]
MSTPAIATYIDAQMATTIAHGLADMEASEAHEAFAAAVTWPITPMAMSTLPIAVTPQVTAAMLELVNGGQGRAFIGTGVDSQEVLSLAMVWQSDLGKAASTDSAAPRA